MKLTFIGKVTCIHHDLIRKRSKIYLNHGKKEVVIERPMTKKYEWQRKKGEEIKRGHYIEVTLKKIKNER